MYIPYYKLTQNLSFFLPKELRKKVMDFGYNLKIKRNLEYIKSNKERVKAKLKQKGAQKEKIHVAFYVYDDSKWLCQSVYDLLEKDERFIPHIFATKNSAPKNNFNYQTKDDVKKVYDFFKTRNMRVQYAYDVQKNKYIPFEKMNPKPDIIIYQHPWYVKTSQGPVVCSKFALTYYIPYFISNADEPKECDLRFHRYIYKYFIPDEMVRESYSPLMLDKGAKLIVAGHPQLDNYLLTKNNRDKKYVIYAPHWTVCGDNIRYGTFDWNGFEILEFAEKHPELNWVFKPHPCLYNFLQTSGYMTKNEVDKYYKRWENAGLIYDKGDYVDIFLQSLALITDGGSFLREYLFTTQPCIHLVSSEFKSNESVRQICETYYDVHNLDEMYEVFNTVLLDKQDHKKQQRQEFLEALNYPYSAEIILNELAKNL